MYGPKGQGTANFPLCGTLRSEFRQAVNVIPVFMNKELRDPELSFLHPSTACRNRGGRKRRGGATSFNWILPAAAPSQFSLSRTVPRNKFLQEVDKRKENLTHPQMQPTSILCSLAKNKLACMWKQAFACTNIWAWGRRQTFKNEEVKYAKHLCGLGWNYLD